MKKRHLRAVEDGSGYGMVEHFGKPELFDQDDYPADYDQYDGLTTEELHQELGNAKRRYNEGDVTQEQEIAEIEATLSLRNHYNDNDFAHGDYDEVAEPYSPLWRRPGLYMVTGVVSFLIASVYIFFTLI